MECTQILNALLKVYIFTVLCVFIYVYILCCFRSDCIYCFHKDKSHYIICIVHESISHIYISSKRRAV